MPDDGNVVPLKPAGGSLAGGSPPPRRRRGVKGIPPGLPYAALGLDEHFIYVLDPNCFLCRVPRNQISRAWIVSLFGEQQELLYETYARFREGKDGPVRIPRSIHTDRAADDLQRLAAAAGRFDPLARLRGIGAWRGQGGDLILHLGDGLFIPPHGGRATGTGPAGVAAPLGPRGDYIYLRRQSVPPPAARAVGADIGTELLAYLSTWRWGRAIDPLLLLGLIGAGFLAGALEYRPQLDLTGEAGSGKSGLQHLCHQLLGPRMLLSSDASAAGIRQRTGPDAILIGLDENESSGDPRRIAELQQLRRASYGEDGESLRGGVDHTPSLFPLRSVFLGSAITLAPMDAATKSRAAVLNVVGPPAATATGARAYAQSDQALEIIGAQLLRRLADHWHRLQGEVLPAWRAILGPHGFDGRAAATYGTLLACAGVLIGDATPTEADYTAHAADLDALAIDDRHDRILSHERLLAFLMGQIVEPARRSGARETLMDKLLCATGYGRTEGTYGYPEAMAMTRARTEDDAQEAARELRQFGIVITSNNGTGARLLAFSTTSPWLESVLRDTPFQSQRGRADGYARTLLRAPGARRLASVRFGHGTTRAIALPLSYVLRGMVGPNPQATAAAWDTVLAGDPAALED